MKIEAVLFDLDGVLVDACDWHYEALNIALKEFGFDIINKQDHLAIFNGLPTKIKLEILKIPDEFKDIINKQKQKYTIDIIKNNAKIMPEKIELHEYLKTQNIKIACVTNSIEETAKKMLTYTGQIAYIDLLISNENIKRNKPYPDCYNLAIDRLEVNPLNVICVEDSPKGIEAAMNSNANNCWIVSNTEDVTKNNYCNYLKYLK
jgi:HAD superfamily hydrolase (TIGR01509 family)